MKKIRAEMEQNKRFIKKLFIKAMFPGIVTILTANINVIVDGILIGRKLGSEALAAINLCQPLFLFMCVIGSFFAAGMTINASHELGQNQIKRASSYFSTCTVVLLIMSVVITIIGLLFHNQIVDFLCSDPTMREYVMEYYLIAVIGAFAKIMIYVPLWFLRLDGENTAVMLMMGVMSIGNIILDVLMVYFWNMGVFGAGLASVVANIVAITLGIIWLYIKKSVFRFHLEFILDAGSWKQIAKVGIPSALNNLASSIRILIINSFLLYHGGSSLVAVFSAVNGIYGFGEGIVLGIPQAAMPMLGIYYGEKDNDSCEIILKLEFFYGMVLSAAFFAIIMIGNRFIQGMYNLDVSLLIPLLWMGLSVFFATACSIIQGYYNISRHEMWANALIIMRMIVRLLIGLFCVDMFKFSTFSFLLIAEAGTIVVWYIVVSIIYKKNSNQTKFFFMDRTLEEKRQVLNFSVDNNIQHITRASEQISSFCYENGLSSHNKMTLQLSIEEMLIFISEMNKNRGNNNTIFYDIRAYSIDGEQGVRIRYNGVYVNPFIEENYAEDQFIGVRLIMNRVKNFEYFKIMGSNMVMLLIEVKNNDIQKI